jgi:hypothetical protein
MFSTPSEVADAAAAMVREGLASPRGFIAATGCEVPAETPEENVHAFVRAAKEAGRNPDFGRQRGPSGLRRASRENRDCPSFSSVRRNR